MRKESGITPELSITFNHTYLRHVPELKVE